MTKIRVLLVDDHHMLRDGLKLLLASEEDMIVIGEAADGKQAVEFVEKYQPDVVVMDLGLPDISGFEATRLIRDLKMEIRVVVLSMHTRKEFIVKAIESGADGYVPKSSTHESLLDAIRTVYSGESYLHPLAASALVNNLMKEEDNEEQRYQDLTSREQEVIRLSAMGYTSREIGEKLIISPKTVDTYRQRAFEKLEINHRSDLVRFAMRIGILDDLKE